MEILTKYSNIILNILLIKLFNNNLTILKNEMNINNFANLKRIVYYLLPYIKIDDTTIRINNIGDLITKKKLMKIIMIVIIIKIYMNIQIFN